MLHAITTMGRGRGRSKHVHQWPNVTMGCLKYNTIVVLLFLCPHLSRSEVETPTAIHNYPRLAYFVVSNTDGNTAVSTLLGQTPVSGFLRVESQAATDQSPTPCHGEHARKVLHNKDRRRKMGQWKLRLVVND
ncbi:hypothetical protein BDV38DRAFT_256718 [Aspergillus pseudotamarii]|uniref:Uncharacterized protein n=1 Tax=Aspergillus pseudotamarii TaxID=132259 RepID=A0A5N6SJ60_ASPPS|nr:uncharacterized protein BDV38DRAFT_256718 [Aspergillus pseudotamarii]KAE8133939.1 hypothetical protein BDV38DRAFT_256718 [Aspergillus pseudotamarii]